MYLHANAKLGLAGRLALVRAIDEGSPQLPSAAARGCGLVLAARKVRSVAPST
jgi:hypothetical protein